MLQVSVRAHAPPNTEQVSCWTQASEFMGRQIRMEQKGGAKRKGAWEQQKRLDFSEELQRLKN